MKKVLVILFIVWSVADWIIGTAIIAWLVERITHGN